MTPSIVVQFAREAATRGARPNAQASEAWHFVVPASEGGFADAGAPSALSCSIRLPAGTTLVARAGSRRLLMAGDVITFDGAPVTYAQNVGDAFERGAEQALRRLSGAYFICYVDVEQGIALVATDRAATRSPCYASDGGHVTVGLTAQPSHLGHSFANG